MSDQGHDPRRARAQEVIARIDAMIEACHASIAHIDGALQTAGELKGAVNRAFNEPFNALPPCDVPPTEHRRLHRPGRPPRIVTDPELQAFIRARIDRLTFKEIAVEVAATFPPARRVGKSAIHAWWQTARPDRSGNP